MNLIPLITTWLGVFFGGYWTFLTVITLLVVHNFLDIIGPKQITRSAHLPNLNIVLHPVLHVSTIFFVTSYVATSELRAFEWWGLMLAVGFCGGIGFVVAHELIHRRERWLRGLGLLVLSTTNYMHFRVEHVFGHHRNVGTDDDPATARFNESIYAFWWRCIPDSYVSALKFEMRRCGSRYFHRKNRMLHYFIVQLFTNGLVYMVWGLKGLLFFLAQSFIAILLLETINYVEHYGLKRSLLPDHKEISDQAERNPSPGGPNRAGPFSPELSWDSPHYFTNAFLFNLGMHAQHHISPSTHYEGLKVHKDAAILPFGYSMMLIMAMVPPLWRGVMNKKLRELGYAV